MTCIEKDTYHNNGYSTVRWEGKTGLAHRKAYADAHGLTRADLEGVVIRHTCDNRKCINPDHLIRGTQGDNLNDRKERHRYRKLTRDDADSIKSELAAGATMSSLSRKYGVSVTMISYIRDGKQWA